MTRKVNYKRIGSMLKALFKKQDMSSWKSSKEGIKFFQISLLFLGQVIPKAVRSVALIYYFNSLEVLPIAFIPLG